MSARAQRVAPFPVLDLGVLTRMVGDDDEVVSDFLGEYGTSLRALAAEIRVAAAGHDVATVAACAHKLKSSSRSVGALALGEICAALEDAAIKGSPPDVAARCLEFERAVALVADRLGAEASADTPPFQ